LGPVNCTPKTGGPNSTETQKEGRRKKRGSGREVRQHLAKQMPRPATSLPRGTGREPPAVAPAWHNQQKKKTRWGEERKLWKISDANPAGQGDVPSKKKGTGKRTERGVGHGGRCRVWKEELGRSQKGIRKRTMGGKKQVSHKDQHDSTCRKKETQKRGAGEESKGNTKHWSASAATPGEYRREKNHPSQNNQVKG